MSGHGGNLRELSRRAGRPVEDLLDFSASINPLGPPECLRPVISRALDAVVNYPDPDAAELVEAIGRRYGLPADRVVVGNGSTEVLHALVRAVPARRAVIPVPTYIDYASAARLAGRLVETVHLSEADGFAIDWTALAGRLAGDEMVFLGQPNNPTGRLFDGDALRRLAAEHPKTLFVVDEAFADFVAGYRSLADDAPGNVVVLRSLTKFYAIPGLRLGFAVARADRAAAIRAQLPPWSVNSPAQVVGVAVLADHNYADRSVACVAEQREALSAGLAGLGGLHVYPSAANFLLVRIDRPGVGAAELAERLLADGIAIRTFPPEQHLDGRFFRVAVRSADENEKLVAALSNALGVPATLRKRKRRTAAIMFQGTSSNAGKSVLTAALCRILLRDGVRVAPFKSQNISLNSFVTRDGGEMGRAQVVQAQACRLEPDVRFNPVLLKPNSDTGRQVIVRGRPVGNMRVAEYVHTAFAAAKECYDSLAGEFDAIVLEGAGSPGEVNLKAHDIVNMRMAEYAAAPVLIVGDIDRGGVFAAFVGTMEVLSRWERALVAGWIVNRFRGDVSLLGPALDYTLLHTGRPVLGVVPYLAALNIPQEDSVDFKSGALDDPEPRAAARGCAADVTEAVDIAVIDLPHISNFTDLDALRVEPDVRVRIIRSADRLGAPDAVILPGSKNVIGDLAYLRTSGLADRIAALAGDDACEIVGLCGGFQMLGRSILDPERIESDAGRADALALLNVSTVLAAEKTLVRVEAVHAPSNCPVVGYEIHHGQTNADGAAPLFTRPTPRLAAIPKGCALGAAREDHRVWGTYLHGVFDADEFRRWFVDRLRVRRGLPPVGRVAARYDIEPALDRLADAVRASLDMDRIYRLMGLR